MGFDLCLDENGFKLHVVISNNCQNVVDNNKH